MFELIGCIRFDSSMYSVRCIRSGSMDSDEIWHPVGGILGRLGALPGVILGLLGALLGLIFGPSRL